MAERRWVMPETVLPPVILERNDVFEMTHSFPYPERVFFFCIAILISCENKCRRKNFKKSQNVLSRQLFERKNYCIIKTK